jgi:hypothetical protein
MGFATRSTRPSGGHVREDCDRFRVIASLQPDGELTRLEAARHAGHAAQCDDCRAYASELAAITARIRATPAQPLLAPITVGMPKPLPARRRLRPAARGAAAMAIGVLVASGLDGSRGRGPGQPVHVAAYFQSIDYERQLLRALRRPAGVRGTSKAV